jgi:hypothetical protein
LKKSTLKDVTLLPTGKFNLFSLSKMLTLGWERGGNKTSIWIKKGDQKVEFDILVPTPMGALHAMHMKRADDDDNNEVANPAVDKTIESKEADPEVSKPVDKKKKLLIGQAHGKFGHCSEALTRGTAKVLKIDLTQGSLLRCDSCAAGKAKQKNVPKMSEHAPRAENNGSIFLDIATIKKTKNGPRVSKPNWTIMVDEATGLKFLLFYQTKKGVVEPTCAQLHRWKEAKR